MSKLKKEDCKEISIYTFNKKGIFNTTINSGMVTWTHGYSGKKNRISFETNLEEGYIELIYTITDRFSGEKTDIKQMYPIITTKCNYGGKRFWFECSVYKSGIYCGRRVAKLYLGGGSNYFACRHCYDLTYESRISGWAYCLPDLEEYEKNIKKWYYKGKPTRKHRILVRKQESFMKTDQKFSQQLLNCVKKMV